LRELRCSGVACRVARENDGARSRGVALVRLDGVR
jgi:hypothetical protein